MAAKICKMFVTYAIEIPALEALVVIYIYSDAYYREN